MHLSCLGRDMDLNIWWASLASQGRGNVLYSVFMSSVTTCWSLFRSWHTTFSKDWRCNTVICSVQSTSSRPFRSGLQLFAALKITVRTHKIGSIDVRRKTFKQRQSSAPFNVIHARQCNFSSTAFEEMYNIREGSHYPLLVLSPHTNSTQCQITWFITSPHPVDGNTRFHR